MSTSDPKKQRERYLLDNFLETLGLQAQIIAERESPDFIVCFNGTEVGIEITELFISHETRTNPRQAIESITDKIVAHAQHLYQESSAPPAHVSICFSPSANANISALYRSNLSERLSSLVRGLNLGLWQVVNLYPEVFEESLLPEEISFIHALGVPSYEMAHWGVARAGWVAPLTIQVLQTRIKEKAKKLFEYQRVTPENWLVIISFNSRPSQMFSVPSEFDPSGIISPFDKTFYYAYPDRKLIELGA
ncbi:MAG: hypothetical protein ACE5EZ_04120 [Thermodesulfobacteriota bacterium]